MADLMDSIATGMWYDFTPSPPTPTHSQQTASDFLKQPTPVTSPSSRPP